MRIMKKCLCIWLFNHNVSRCSTILALSIKIRCPKCASAYDCWRISGAAGTKILCAIEEIPYVNIHWCATPLLPRSSGAAVAQYARLMKITVGRGLSTNHNHLGTLPMYTTTIGCTILPIKARVYKIWHHLRYRIEFRPVRNAPIVVPSAQVKN